MNNLQPLKWTQNDSSVWSQFGYELNQATGAGVAYSITALDNEFVVTINNLVKQSKGEPRSSDSKTLSSYGEARSFVEKEHYPHFMSEFIKTDTIGSYFDKFTQWGLDRGIIQNGNELAQGLKLVSEMGELADNLAKGRCIKDDIGDMMVVLNMLAQMTGVKVEDCLAQAWGDIKDRKGYMNEHGVFIKDGDVEVTK